MARPVSRKLAFLVAGGFTVLGIALGAFRVIPDDVRAAAAYPILAGFVIAVWDLISNTARIQSVAGALLLVAGSVIVGYRSTAEAMADPVLAITTYGFGAAALGTIVVLAAKYWIGDPHSDTSRVADSPAPAFHPPIKPDHSDTKDHGRTGS